jgi:hypothetical protein
MAKTYLLSRTLDPLLGVFTGFLAYYLHETNPRTAPPPGHTLRDLMGWQWDQSSAKRQAEAAATQVADAAEMEAVRREIEADVAPVVAKVAMAEAGTTTDGAV